GSPSAWRPTRENPPPLTFDASWATGANELPPPSWGRAGVGGRPHSRVRRGGWLDRGAGMWSRASRYLIRPPSNLAGSPGHSHNGSLAARRAGSPAPILQSVAALEDGTPAGCRSVLHLLPMCARCGSDRTISHEIALCRPPHRVIPRHIALSAPL